MSTRPGVMPSPSSSRASDVRFTVAGSSWFREMQLYRFRHSTNVDRVVLALAYKGLDAESVWVDPADRSPVEQVSGQPLVPVLVDGDEVVADSTTIIEHLERA